MLRITSHKTLCHCIDYMSNKTGITCYIKSEPELLVLDFLI